MELLVIAIILLVLAAVGTLAAAIGVDSRDFSDDPHRPSYPVGIA